MKFKITGVEETKTGSIDDKGNVVGAKGGTEMIKEALIKRLDPDLASQFNIIHSRVREIDPNKKNILVLHDLFGDPEAQHLKDPESRRRFSKLVFVSNWQFQQYNLALGVTYRDSIVLKNAIEPINDVEKSTDGPIRLIYHTTPHRGLELLVPAYEVLYKKYGDKIVLDVYSSFNIYGWPQRDEQYKSVFDKCREHPGINYHGAVSNEEVREALKKAGGEELADSPVLAPAPGEPQDMEQLEMEQQFGYKHVMSMEAEQAVSLSFYQNKFDDKRKRTIENLFDFGMGGYTQWIGENGHVKLREINPENMVLSY